MRRLLPVILGAVLLLTSAAAVSAHTTAIVDALGCAIFTGGATTVEPGSDVVLRGGWDAKTWLQDVQFVTRSTTILTVDGRRVIADRYYGKPTNVGPDDWRVVWDYPAGRLHNGQSMVVIMDVIINRPIYDGYDWYPVGSLFGGPVTCVITGAHAV